MALNKAWSASVDEVVRKEKIDVSKGLSDGEVAARRQQFGFNELHQEPPTPLWRLVLEQFDDALVKVCASGCLAGAALAFKSG